MPVLIVVDLGFATCDGIRREGRMKDRKRGMDKLGKCIRYDIRSLKVSRLGMGLAAKAFWNWLRLPASVAAMEKIDLAWLGLDGWL